MVLNFRKILSAMAGLMAGLNHYIVTSKILRQMNIIEDVIGQLPSLYFNLLLLKDISRAKRFQIVCFLYCNGCPLELFFDLRDACGDKDLDKAAFVRKWQEFDYSESLRAKYFSFNLHNGRYELLNGQIYFQKNDN